MTERLVYQTSPVVTVASNTFERVPVILQFDDVPLIALVREQQLGYTTEIPVYHSDGTYLAKVRGTRIWPTKEGEKAGLKVNALPQLTVCTIGKRTVFEIAHERGDAFRTTAELYTPTGYFVKAADSAFLDNPEGLKIGGLHMTGCTFVGCRIGVWFKSDGSCAIGVS